MTLSSPFASQRAIAKTPSGADESAIFNILYSLGAAIFLGVAFWRSCARIDRFPLEILIFVINGGLSIYGQTQSFKRGASINYISFFFCYLFMAITPLFQLGDGDDFVFEMDSVALRAGMMAVMFTMLGVFCTSRIPISTAGTERPVVSRTEPNYLPLFLLTASISVAALIVYGKLLFTNREAFDDAQIKIFGDPQIAMVVGTILSSVPFFGAVIGLRAAWASRSTGRLTLFVVLTLSALVLNNPLVTARFVLAGMVVFFIDYMSRGRGMKLIAVFLVAGVLVAPALQAFRYAEAEVAGVESQDKTNPFSETGLPHDYDAFQILCYTIVTVDQDGVLWGSNILGAGLFFVPRTLWPEKPQPSPYLIYSTILNYRDVGSNNLSTPLMAEGYYAFGWLGAFLISVLYWVVLSRVVVLSRRNPYSFIFLLRCVLAGLTLITLRGSLIVVTSFIVAAAFSAAAPWLVCSNFLRVGRQSHPKIRTNRRRTHGT